MSSMDQSNLVTKQDLQEGFRMFGDNIRKEIRDATSDVISHFNKSQTLQNERMDRMDQRFDRIDARLEDVAQDVSKIKLAVLDLMATDRHLHNLVKALKNQGIHITEAEVFA